MTVDVNRQQVIRLRETTAAKNKDYWSEEERSELSQMYLDGYGITEMAIHFDRSEMAIINQLNIRNLLCRANHCESAKKPKCKCPKCAFFAQCKGGLG